MEWFIPLTILPGIGMIVLSTSTQMIAVSTEIKEMLSRKCSEFEHKIVRRKISQLKRLTITMTLLYISCAFIVGSSILPSISTGNTMSSYSHPLFVTGGSVALIALGLLIDYGFRTIRIRTMQHEQNLNL